MIQLIQKTPSEISKEVAQRVKLRRKEKKWTQSELAKRAGMSFASYKRFDAEEISETAKQLYLHQLDFFLN